MFYSFNVFNNRNTVIITFHECGARAEICAEFPNKADALLATQMVKHTIFDIDENTQAYNSMRTGATIIRCGADEYAGFMADVRSDATLKRLIVRIKAMKEM